MAQPLTARPAYGERRPATPVAESGLPGTGPSDRGLPLDGSIPGTSTFNKPEEDHRDFDKAESGSIYRKDGPDSLAKPQEDAEGDRRDNQRVRPEFNSPGGPSPDDPTVTKYPYRDGRPNQHNASEQVAFVAGLYQLRFAHDVRVSPSGRMTRTAARMDDLISGLNPKTLERSALCSINVKRVDASNLRWIFSVDCGNGAKVVRLKARRVGNIVRLTKMDLNVSCSCPGWRWLGPEHHAKSEGYLDGRPKGTASSPDIKDPERQNRVCKHVAAVLSFIRGWDVPLPEKKG